MKYRAVRKSDGFYYVQYFNPHLGSWCDSFNGKHESKAKAISERNEMNKINGF